MALLQEMLKSIIANFWSIMWTRLVHCICLHVAAPLTTAEHNNQATKQTDAAAHNSFVDRSGYCTGNTHVVHDVINLMDSLDYV